MEQTTFNIWHQSQSKKEATAGCPHHDFCMHRKIAFFAAVRGAETTKFCQRKKRVQFFQTQFTRLPPDGSCVLLFQIEFFSRVFNVFGDMLLVHFYSLGF